MNSIHVDVNKSDLLSLHNENETFNIDLIILKVFELIEKEGNVKLQQQISESLSNDIKLKVASLFDCLKRVNAADREKFRKNVKSRFVRFQIKSPDFEENTTLIDYLNTKYEACKSRLDLATRENDLLNDEIKILNSKIEILHNRLKQNEAEMNSSMKKTELLQKQLQQLNEEKRQFVVDTNKLGSKIENKPFDFKLVDKPDESNQSKKIRLEKANEIQARPPQHQTSPIIQLQQPKNMILLNPQRQLIIIEAPNKQKQFVFVQPNQLQNCLQQSTSRQNQGNQPEVINKSLIQSSVRPHSQIQPNSKEQTKSPAKEVVKRPKQKLISELTEETNIKRLNANLKRKIDEVYEQTISQNVKNNEQEKKIKDLVPKKATSLKMFRHRKDYFDCHVRQQAAIKRNLREMLNENFEHGLSLLGLCIYKVIIVPLDIQDYKFKIEIQKDISDDQKEADLNKLLYYKDKFSISDKAYNELKVKCDLKISSLSRLKKRRAEIDEHFNIFMNKKGAYVSAEAKIKFQVISFFERKYNLTDAEAFSAEEFKDEIIHIRLAADGTNIGRNMKLLNITFTILNEGPRSLTANGNYTLGIYEMETENYENLSICFKELVEELAKLKQIKIGVYNINLIFYYSGDWKMLAYSLGIQSANSRYPCVWCKCCKDDFSDRSLEWSITDPDKGARSLEELIRTVQLENNSKTIKYGYDKLPFLKDIIPTYRYMIDMLHLFLRISDTLINLLVKDCTLIDKFESWTITRFDVTEFKHLHAFQKFLNEKCKVSFKFMWLSETKKLTWRDLVGPDKIKLFEAFDLKEIIPEHDNLESLQKLWDDFFEIITAVKRVELSHIEVKQSTEEWLDLFLTIYNKTTVTPYIHAFVAHLHEFVFLYKDINAFNLQGLEKLNDMTTYQYFKGTNKRDNYLMQIMKKRNRMERLRNFIDDDDLDSRSFF